MSELVRLGRVAGNDDDGKSQFAGRRPEWMRVKIRNSKVYRDVDRLISGLELNTVCEEARCPNIWECWGEHRTATFMILGDICTRACRYCSITSGRPEPPSTQEPENVARAVQHLNLEHAVVTSVERDDLSDFGAAQFVRTIEAIRACTPDVRIEVLVPEFGGDASALDMVLAAGPDVLNHNIETVPRLFPSMRAKGSFQRSLELLHQAHHYRAAKLSGMRTKSGLIVGLGEDTDEVLSVMDALRRVECDILTVGQYLNPTRKHAPVQRFYRPEEFQRLREEGLQRGFAHVESGPLVRSSYHASSHVDA